jgi:hypothetical protein
MVAELGFEYLFSWLAACETSHTDLCVGDDDADVLRAPGVISRLSRAEEAIDRVPKEQVRLLSSVAEERNQRASLVRKGVLLPRLCEARYGDGRRLSAGTGCEPKACEAMRYCKLSAHEHSS